MVPVSVYLNVLPATIMLSIHAFRRDGILKLHKGLAIIILSCCKNPSVNELKKVTLCCFESVKE